MKPDLAELKYQVHAARVALSYQEKTNRPERDGDRNEQIKKARARLEAALAAYKAAQPEPVSLRVRSPYFIGPRRAKGVRGNGPTITCFRCSEEKPVSDFYERGCICRKCTIHRSGEWARKNPERVTEIKRESSRSKRKNNPGFRAFINCRNRLNKIMRGISTKRGSHFSELTGITAKGLSSHLEAQFSVGMSWSNYGLGRGKWVVDHITPARLFDHTIEAELKSCWHYTNLRPMWSPDNQEKSDKLPCGRRARHVKILLTT